MGLQRVIRRIALNEATDTTEWLGLPPKIESTSVLSIGMSDPTVMIGAYVSLGRFEWREFTAADAVGNCEHALMFDGPFGVGILGNQWRDGNRET